MQSVFSPLRSLKVRALTGTAVMVAAAFAFTMTLDARSSVIRSKEWAATHHRAISGISLQEFAAYPEDYRKAMLGEMSGEDHSRLWQTQLSLVLKHETLTAQQRAFVLTTMAEATPASFEPNAQHPEVCQDIATLFPDKRVRKEMVTLGAAVEAVSTWRPFLISLTERVRSSVVADAGIVYCNCRGMGLCECGIFDSCMDAPNCQQTGQCGCIWLGDCDQRQCQSGLIIDSLAVKAGPTTTVK